MKLIPFLLRPAAGISFGAALAVSPAAAGALPASPTDPVSAVFAILAAGQKGKDGIWFRPPHRDRLLSRSLAALFAADDRYMSESGDQGHLDVDVAANSQDPDISGLSLKDLGQRGGAATVQATFGAGKGRMTVDFRIVREAGAYRIDDVRPHVRDGTILSARKLLSRPYPCGSTTTTPCKR